MIDILSFISNLQARRSHSKMHCVHVNLTWDWLTLCRLVVCVDVLVARHGDFNLLLAPFVDRLCKAKEAWMGTCSLLRQELLMSQRV